MKSLKPFEPPKIGENILVKSNTNKIVLWIMIIVMISLSVVVYKFNIIPFLFGDKTFVIFVSGVLLFWGIYNDYKLNKFGKIEMVFYFDECLQIDENKVSFQYFDNFLHIEEGYIVIVFSSEIPSLQEISKYDQRSDLFITLKLGKGYIQKMKTSKKYKNNSIELVNFLNEKIENKKN